MYSLQCSISVSASRTILKSIGEADTLIVNCKLHIDLTFAFKAKNFLNFRFRHAG